MSTHNICFVEKFKISSQNYHKKLLNTSSDREVVHLYRKVIASNLKVQKTKNGPNDIQPVLKRTQYW